MTDLQPQDPTNVLIAVLTALAAWTGRKPKQPAADGPDVLKTVFVAACRALGPVGAIFAVLAYRIVENSRDVMVALATIAIAVLLAMWWLSQG